MRYRKRVVCACFAVLINNVHAKDSTPLPEKIRTFAWVYSIEPPFRVRGRGFKWDHEIQVALPATYTTEKKAYPTLWVTDGLINFSLAVETLEQWTTDLPEMIIVGVGTPADAYPEHQERREYEFTPKKEIGGGFGGIGADFGRFAEKPKFGTGGAPKFLDFLVDELRTKLESKYRMSDSHTIFGSSGGGYFCTYALLVRPRSFDKYVCLSPNLYGSDYELFRIEQKYSEVNKDLPAAVYFAAGENEILQGGLPSALGIVSSMSRMAELLKMRAYPSLRLYVHIFPDEEHTTYTSSGLAHGLLALWGKNDRNGGIAKENLHQ